LKIDGEPAKSVFWLQQLKTVAIGYAMCFMYAVMYNYWPLVW